MRREGSRCMRESNSKDVERVLALYTPQARERVSLKLHIHILSISITEERDEWNVDYIYRR